MRILFLTDNFPPESNAPASRTYEHAREWIKQGAEVTVITCAPNFPEGKVFEGYSNRWIRKENIGGIEVWRVKTFISSNEGFLLRTLDFISFMLSSFLFGLFTRRHDVIVGTSPQFFTVLSAWALSKLKRVPFVFELRDIWPESIVAVGAMERNWVIRILEHIELFLYSQARSIVAVTQSFKSSLTKRGVEPDKVAVILNGVDLGNYKPQPEKDPVLSVKYRLQGKFVVGYVGTHGLAHGLEHVVSAAELLKENADVCFIFAGSGSERHKIEQLVQQKALQNIILIEKQPKENMSRLWSLCDVALVSLRDTPLFSAVIPSKIFEAMGMGVPILMSVPKGEATKIVSENNCGICVPPESSKAIAEAVLSLFQNPQQIENYALGAKNAAPKFDRVALANQMLTLLKSVSQAT